MNHDAICTGLRLIVAGAARRFWFPQADDRQEIEAEVLLEAIKRIDRFRFSKGNDAFAYYSTLALNAIRRQLVKLNALRRRAMLFTDVESMFNGSSMAGKDSDLGFRDVAFGPLDFATNYARV